MREMVFNHSSASHLNVDRAMILEWFIDTLRGMTRLVVNQVVHNSLRMARLLDQVECSPGYSLRDALATLRNRGYRDEYIFFMKLSSKFPLLNEVDEGLVDRFYGCEGQLAADIDGSPLVLCAISDWVAIAFPSLPVWDRDCIPVEFVEIADDGEILRVCENIDQLSRLKHAEAISERHRGRMETGKDPVSIWENREAIFPNLVFGPGVENGIKSAAKDINTILGKLFALDQSAKEWNEVRGPAPKWRTSVTPESSQKMKNAKFRNSRTFRSYHGTQKVFEWHARFGDSGRIHLRFDPNKYEVEIGDIGPHLRL